MAFQESIKIIHGALDEHNGDIILRGVVDPGSFENIQVDDYQREILSGASFDNLVKAFQTGKKVPDITLGMRGGRVRDHGDTYYLQDGVYVVDGLQRISAARRAVQDKPDTVPHLGAVVYFETTKEWEREQFMILNADRIKVSPNVLLRNMRESYPVVAALHSMSMTDKSFMLHERVCWTQRMMRRDVIYARVMLRTICFLHSHVGPARSTRIEQFVPGLQLIMERVGKNIFRENVRTFFEIVDECWGIRQVVYKGGATHLRATFLQCLAEMFSNNPRYFFKENNRLAVDIDTRRKLKQFPLNDPEIMRLASSGGQSGVTLYIHLVKHINRGRRKNRLTLDTVEEESIEESAVGENGEDENAS